MEVPRDLKSEGGDNHESPSLVVSSSSGGDLVEDALFLERSDSVDALHGGPRNPHFQAVDEHSHVSTKRAGEE